MASRELEGFGQKLGGLGALGKVAAVGLAGIAAAGVGLVAGLTGSISQAMDFEAAMSAVSAVAGGTDADLKALSDTALKLGQDTTLSGVSATDAARAMRELAAAGMTVEQIVGGGALGALRLASAGGIDVARAAEIAAMALAGFGLSGSEAARVADLFAGAANSSAISVDDIAETMKYVAPIAKTMGLSIEEVTATIAALGNQGIKGSQAGTSLRSMIVSLAKPSKEASKLMTNLGLSFFDTNGEMKDLAGISGELKTKLSGLTDKQRASALAVLFGNEALSAAAVLYGEGAEGITKWLGEVTTGATAAETGAKRNDNLKGSIEALKSSFETAQIVLGRAFLPALKGIVDQMALGVSAAIPLVEAWGPRLVAGIQSAITVISQFGGYIAGAIGAIVGAFQSLQSGQTTMAGFIGGVKTLISTVLGDIGGLLGNAAAFVAPYLTQIGQAITAALPIVGAEIGKLASLFGTWVQTTALPYLAANLPLWLGAIGTFLTGTALPAIAGFVGGIASAFGGWIQGSAIPYLQANLPLWLAALSTWISGTAAPAVATAITSIANAFSGWITTTAIPYLQTNLPLFLDAITGWITSTALPAITAAVTGLSAALVSWIRGEDVAAQFTGWQGAVLQSLANAVGLLDEFVGIAGPKLSEWIKSEETQAKLKDLAVAVGNGIADILNALSDFSSKAGVKLHKWLFAETTGPLWLHDWGELARVTAQGVDGVLAKLDKLGTDGVARLGDWMNTAGPKWLHDWNELGRIAGDAMSALGTTIHDALAGIAASVGAAASAIGTAIIDGIANALTGGGGRLGGIAASVVNQALEAAKGALGIKSPSKEFAYVGEMAIQGLINGMDEKQGEAAKKAADVASAVAKAVTDVIGAGAALGKVNIGGGPSGAQLGWLRDTSVALVTAMQDAAKGFKDEGLKAAGEFADTAGKIGGSIKNTLDGLAALAGFDFAKSSPNGSALGWFTHLATSLVANFAQSAQLFGEGLLKDAGELGDAASKVGGSVKNAIDGLAALASAKWADISPSGSAMAWFTHLIASLVQNFATAAKEFAEGAFKAASDFADSAGKVAGVIGPAVAGFAALATLVTPSQTTIDQLVAGIRYMVKRFAEMAATMQTEGVKALGDFSDATNKALSAAKTGTDLFKSFDKLVIPSAKAIDDLSNGIRYIVGKFREMAGMLTTEGLAAMTAFATTAGQVLGAAKSGTDLFASMDKLAIPSKAAIDYLLGSMGYVITQTQAIANGIGTAGIAAAAAFATGTLNVFTIIKTALTEFAGLKEYKDIPTKALDDLFKALETTLEVVGGLVSRSDEIKQGALEYLANMQAAFQAYQAGSSIAIGGGVSLSAPAGVGAGGGSNGGGGERGQAGTTYNITVAGDVYDGASFQDKVVSVLDTAERRGR